MALAAFCMDKIIISKLSLFCHIGVESTERVRAQQILVTVELFTSTLAAGTADDVQKTIDYSIACKEIKSIAEKEWHTIEGLAEAIAAHVKSRFNPQKIIVSIEKPNALAKQGAAFAGVVIER